MAETADFVTVMSSELIAEVMEAYFNERMFKKAVKIVDLKPTADGYAFSLAFTDAKKEVKQQTEVVTEKRDGKGRFATVKGVGNVLP